MKPGRALVVALCGTVLAGAGAAAGAAAGQAAVHPHAGSTYRGKITETSGTKVLASQPILFTVDRKGKTVTNFTLRNGYPVWCAPKGIGEAQSTTARVLASGKFKAELPIYAAHHRRQGSLVVTGTFAPHNLESGTVKTVFIAASRHSCNGAAHYKTKAK